MKIKSYDLRLNSDKILQLVEEDSVEYNTDDERFSNPEKIAKMMKSAFDMDNLATEHMFILAMNSKFKILGIFELSAGCMNETLCGIRELFQRLLIIGATDFVITHNHCSGYVEPSACDNNTSKRIQKASNLLGIGFLDHIIVGTEGYYSMKEMGDI